MVLVDWSDAVDAVMSAGVGRMAAEAVVRVAVTDGWQRSGGRWVPAPVGLPLPGGAVVTVAVAESGGFAVEAPLRTN